MARKMKSRSPAKKRAGKEPWIKPRLKSGKLFEVNSLACGKSTGQTSSCFQNVTMS